MSPFTKLLALLLLYASRRAVGEGESYCYHNCSGHGQCVDYTCRCDAGWHGESCRTQYSSLPVLSVGHVNLTKSTYNDLCRSNKREILFIAVATSACARCATVEPEYHYLMEQIRELDLPVRLARVDGAGEPELVRELGVSDYPSFVLARKRCKAKYVYRGLLQGQSLLGYALKQVEGAVTKVATEEQADRVISKIVRNNQGLHTLVVAIGAFPEGAGYEDEIEDFEEACAALQAEEHIFCMLTVGEVTGMLLKNRPAQRAPQLVLVRIESPVQFAKEEDVAWVAMLRRLGKKGALGDVSGRYLALSEPIGQNIPLEKWILRNGLPLVSEIGNMNFAMYDKSKLPMVMLFRDPDESSERRLVRTFRSVAKQLEERFVFVTANRKTYSDKMKALGLFDGDSSPSLTINLRRSVVVPFDGDLSSPKELLNYLETYLARRLGTLSSEDLEKLSIKAAKQEKARRLAVDEVVGVKEHFKPGEDDIVHVTAQGVTDLLVEDESRDIVLLVYEAGKEDVMSVAPVFKRVAKRFTDLNIATLVVAAIDVLEHPLPRALATRIQSPSLVLFPAHSREPPYLFFSGEFKVGPIMHWVRNGAALPFVLPELPQFNAEERKLYKEQIKELEERREAVKEL